jgi:hypothetical protein
MRGRSWSHSFALHLSLAAFALKGIAPPGLIVELGAGFGGLARILKYLCPQAPIVLVDLPTSLVVSYAYLALNFPHAKLRIVEDLEADDPETWQSDFVFVPHFLKSVVAGRKIDLFVNTLSLAHIPSDQYREYHRFIEDECDVDVFANVNCYRANPGSLRIDGTHYRQDLRAQRSAVDLDGPSTLQSHAALWGNRWEILDWHLDAGDKPPFLYNDSLFQPLFLKLQKRRPATMSADMDAQIARGAFEEAIARGRIDSATHRLLWTACQRDAQPHYLREYIRILEADGSPVAGELRAQLSETPAVKLHHR